MDFDGFSLYSKDSLHCVYKQNGFLTIWSIFTDVWMTWFDCIKSCNAFPSSTYHSFLYTHLKNIDVIVHGLVYIFKMTNNTFYINLLFRRCRSNRVIDGKPKTAHQLWTKWTWTKHPDTRFVINVRIGECTFQEMFGLKICFMFSWLQFW